MDSYPDEYYENYPYVIDEYDYFLYLLIANTKPTTTTEE